MGHFAEEGNELSCGELECGFLIFPTCTPNYGAEWPLAGGEIAGEDRFLDDGGKYQLVHHLRHASPGHPQLARGSSVVLEPAGFHGTFNIVSQGEEPGGPSGGGLDLWDGGALDRSLGYCWVLWKSRLQKSPTGVK